MNNGDKLGEERWDEPKKVTEMVGCEHVPIRWQPFGPWHSLHLWLLPSERGTYIVLEGGKLKILCSPCMRIASTPVSFRAD